MQNETTINTIFGVIQTLLHQIHQLWGRTTGANSQREKMAYRSIRSLRSPKLFAPAFTTGLRAMVFVTISGFLVLAKGQSATNCPPNSFPNTTNLAMNPSFEKNRSKRSFHDLPASLARRGALRSGILERAFEQCAG